MMTWLAYLFILTGERLALTIAFWIWIFWGGSILLKAVLLVLFICYYLLLMLSILTATGTTDFLATGVLLVLLLASWLSLLLDLLLVGRDVQKVGKS